MEEIIKKINKLHSTVNDATENEFMNQLKRQPLTQTTNHKRIFYLLKNAFVFSFFFSPQLIFTYRTVIFGCLEKK